jgi:hypothetical protein
MKMVIFVALLMVIFNFTLISCLRGAWRGGGASDGRTKKTRPSKNDSRADS